MTDEPNGAGPAIGTPEWVDLKARKLKQIEDQMSSMNLELGSLKSEVMAAMPENGSLLVGLLYQLKRTVTTTTEWNTEYLEEHLRPLISATEWADIATPQPPKIGTRPIKKLAERGGEIQIHVGSAFSRKSSAPTIKWSTRS